MTGRGGVLVKYGAVVTNAGHIVTATRPYAPYCACCPQPTCQCTDCNECFSISGTVPGGGVTFPAETNSGGYHYDSFGVTIPSFDIGGFLSPVTSYWGGPTFTDYCAFFNRQYSYYGQGQSLVQGGNNTEGDTRVSGRNASLFLGDYYNRTTKKYFCAVMDMQRIDKVGTVVAQDPTNVGGYWGVVFQPSSPINWRGGGNYLYVYCETQVTLDIMKNGYFAVAGTYTAQYTQTVWWLSDRQPISNDYHPNEQYYQVRTGTVSISIAKEPCGSADCPHLISSSSDSFTSASSTSSSSSSSKSISSSSTSGSEHHSSGGGGPGGSGTSSSDESLSESESHGTSNTSASSTSDGGAIGSSSSNGSSLSSSSSSSSSSGIGTNPCHSMPVITSTAIAYFNDGHPMPAGVYTITYLTGALKWYSGFSEWTVSTEDYAGSGDGYYIVYGGGTALWPPTADVAIDTDVPATQVGLSVTINHTGGMIGIIMQDSNYSDNIPSPTLGPPTFQIDPCTGNAGCVRPYNTGQSVLTGSDSELTCDQDAQWSYNGGPAAAPSGGYGEPGPSNGSTYRWITKQCDGHGLIPDIGNVFTTTVGIPAGTNLTTYSLSGQWSADNWLDSITVNGTPIDIGFFTSVSGAYGVATGYTSVELYCTNEGVSNNDYSFGSLWPFQIPASAPWVIGNNTIAFNVGDAGDDFGGLLVEWDEPCGGTESASSSTSSTSSSGSSSSSPDFGCTVTPDVLSDRVAYFNHGSSFAAGTYTISYVSGALSYSGGGNWTVTTEDFPGHGDGYFAVFSHASSESSNDHIWPATASQSADTDVAATQSGLSLVIHHDGGPIGMFLRDDEYGDNAAGPTVDAPTFALSPCTEMMRRSVKPCGVCRRKIA